MGLGLVAGIDCLLVIVITRFANAGFGDCMHHMIPRVTRTFIYRYR